MQSIHQTNNQIAAYLIVAVLVTGVTMSVLDSIQKPDEISPKFSTSVQDSTPSENKASENLSQSIKAPVVGSDSLEMILFPN